MRKATMTTLRFPSTEPDTWQENCVERGSYTVEIINDE